MAGIPNGWAVNDAANFPCKAYEIAWPIPQPGQGKSVKNLKGQNEK